MAIILREMFFIMVGVRLNEGKFLFFSWSSTEIWLKYDSGQNSMTDMGFESNWVLDFFSPDILGIVFLVIFGAGSED